MLRGELGAEVPHGRGETKQLDARRVQLMRERLHVRGEVRHLLLQRGVAAKVDGERREALADVWLPDAASRSPVTCYRRRMTSKGPSDSLQLRF